GRRTFRKRHAKLEEHLLQSRRCNRNQHLGRSGTFVLEGMRRSDRHVGKHPGAGHQAFVANRESDLTVEDVESFFLSAVNVRGWTAPWRNNGFQQGILAVRVLAGRQKAVHVADDGQGAAFPLLLDDGLCHVRLLHLRTVERPPFSIVLISRRCRTMAHLRKKDIIHNSNRAKTDLALSRKERVTRVSLPLRLNSQVSSKPVANLDSGAEKSFISSRRRWSGSHSTISST